MSLNPGVVEEPAQFSAEIGVVLDYGVNVMKNSNCFLVPANWHLVRKSSEPPTMISV